MKILLIISLLLNIFLSFCGYLSLELKKIMSKMLREFGDILKEDKE